MRAKLTVGMLLVAVACLACLSLIGLRRSAELHHPIYPLIAGRGAYGEEIVLASPLPDMPTQIPRLRLIYPEVTLENVKEITVQVFGFTGEIRDLEFPVSENAIWIRDNLDRDLMVNLGDLYYSAGPPPGDPLNPPELPSYEEVRKIADDFLEEIKTWKLMPTNSEIEIVLGDVYPSHETSMILENEEVSAILALSTSFTLKFKGFEIWPRISIEVVENGKINYFRCIWAEVEENGNISSTALITPTEALERLKSGDYGSASSYASSGMVKRSIIENVDLIYCFSPGQDYLWPVHRFEVTFELEDGSTFDFSQFVRAEKGV
jgi:hypothetical protein